MIISDNGRQFDNQGFKDFYSKLGIRNQFSSPGHPQVNGQTEVTNRILLKIIKTKLDEAKGAWLKNYLTSSGLTGPRQEPRREKPPLDSLMAQKP